MNSSDDALTFEQVVDNYYPSLYRFGLSLSCREEVACDLVQETFRRYAAKGRQIRDRSRVKSWLFTTLYREFLRARRKDAPLESMDNGELANVLPAAERDSGDVIDAKLAQQALGELEEIYRAPLALFYLEEHSYQEIAGILDVPLGTVMSRLARGRELLRKRLQDTTALRESRRAKTGSLL